MSEVSAATDGGTAIMALLLKSSSSNVAARLEIDGGSMEIALASRISCWSCTRTSSWEGSACSVHCDALRICSDGQHCRTGSNAGSVLLSTTNCCNEDNGAADI